MICKKCGHETSTVICENCGINVVWYNKYGILNKVDDTDYVDYIANNQQTNYLDYTIFQNSVSQDTEDKE